MMNKFSGHIILHSDKAILLEESRYTKNNVPALYKEK